jgi:DNA-binding IclR family transcriptional regulator
MRRPLPPPSPDAPKAAALRRARRKPLPAKPRRADRAAAPPDPARDYSAPALEKGLEIIEHLARQPVPVSLSDIARALGRTSSEIFRMLALLEQRGYVRRTSESGRYVLSLRLYLLGRAHNPLGHLLSAAQFPMHSLTERTQEPCHLAIVRDGRLHLIARAEAPKPIRLTIDTGAAFDVGSSSSGRLIAAMLDDTERNLRGIKAPPDAARIRRQGFIVEPSHVLEGVENISLPVLLPDDVAALTIARIKGRHSKGSSDRLLAEGRVCVAAIVDALGLGSLGGSPEGDAQSGNHP